MENGCLSVMVFGGGRKFSGRVTIFSDRAAARPGAVKKVLSKVWIAVYGDAFGNIFFAGVEPV